jgi:putative membrane protein
MIGKTLLILLANILALFGLSWLLPNVSLGYPVGANFSWAAFWAARWIVLSAAVVLVIMTRIVTPILKLIALPINFLTIGLANALISFGAIWLAIILVPGFNVGALTIFGLNLGIVGGIAVFAILFSFLETVLLSVLE